MGERWTRPDRFRSDELEGDLTAGEQAEMIATARELEWLAATDDVAPSAGFADRVMTAVAAEPTPRPMTAAASAARRGAFLGVLAAFGDLWRVAMTGGRPMAVRAPAMALVLVILAGTLGAGALGVGALSGLLDGSRETPPPSQVTSPSPAVPSGSPSPSPSPSASPSPSPSPSASPSATPDSSESPEPSETPSGTDDATAPPRPSPSATSEPTRTPRPTETPKPTETPEPGETPRPTDEAESDNAGGGSDDA